MNDQTLTVSEILTKAGIVIRGVEAISDRLLSLICPTCGSLQTLSQARIRDSSDVGMISEYACKNCSETIVATGHWGFGATDDLRSAYRLGEYAIYPAADLSILVGENVVLLPIM
jgi:predicted RNA-binding Zn-ribbon protein involved in translation (DUF1610 family)